MGWLRGLEAQTNYVLTELNTGASRTVSGGELMGQGVSVSITDQPGAAVYTYEEAK